MEHFIHSVSDSAQTNDFLDMVAGIQGSRMNDQRAALPKFPGLHNSEEVLDQLITNKSDDNTSLDDGFFEMLMRCQVGQRPMFCIELEICTMFTFPKTNHLEEHKAIHL